MCPAWVSATLGGIVRTIWYSYLSRTIPIYPSKIVLFVRARVKVGGWVKVYRVCMQRRGESRLVGGGVRFERGVCPANLISLETALVVSRNGYHAAVGI